MRASALWLAMLGLAASFLPQEILAAFGVAALPLVVAGVQLLGAAYIGLGMLNWMAQGNLIGGIYSRPVAVCNLAHFSIAFIVLAKLALGTSWSLPVAVPAAGFGVFAVMFGIVFRTHPVGAR